MNNNNTYDVIVIGGGLAGLALAIQLSGKGYSVLVLEKESFPRHKVCGEYISLESRPFLERIGLPLDKLQLPRINRLQVTDSRGNEVHALLPLGGFGISRYLLDDALAKLAVRHSVTLLTETKAEDVQWHDDHFIVKAGGNEYFAKIVCGAWGKRSNMDIRLRRNFIAQPRKGLDNYVGIKYHIQHEWPARLIGLHNFAGGYCGISQIENGKCCLCYLTSAAHLQKSGDIKQLETGVLMKNQWLGDIFRNATFLYESLLAISQISFQGKEQVLDHVLLLGDAAGVITPLCGNGMSMAFRASVIATDLIDQFLKGSISRAHMEKKYCRDWKQIFSTRLTIGGLVQSNFGKERTTSLFLKTMNAMPFIKNAVIKNASGAVF